MDVTLVVAEGRAKTRQVKLRRAETVVGRAKGCDLRIPSDEVSRRHCVLRVGDDDVRVEDLGSSNGTFLNGTRVEGQAAVQPGDRLGVGPLTFVVQYEESAIESVEVVREEPAAIPLAADDGAEAIPVMEDTDNQNLLQIDDSDQLDAYDSDDPPDQRPAWAMPEAQEMRGILEGLETGDVDTEKPKRKKGKK